MLLRSISWGTYESLLTDHLDSSAPRFAYDQGGARDSESKPRAREDQPPTAQLVAILAEELDLEFEDLGSTTFKRGDLGRGFDPDYCLLHIERETHPGQIQD